VLQCVAACCSVLQCVAVCCSVLQCVTVRYSALQSDQSARELAISEVTRISSCAGSNTIEYHILMQSVGTHYESFLGIQKCDMIIYRIISYYLCLRAFVFWSTSFLRNVLRYDMI